MVELTKEEITKVRLELNIKDGAKKAIYGFLAFIIGVSITLVTLIISRSSYYIISYGLTIGGFIYMIVGICRYFTSKYKYNKLTREK